MGLKIRTPKLVINHLVLVGHRKNYKVTFDSGFNLIYGDSDTGKSSILNLIDYCLGASSVDLYDEIEMAGRYCLLEVLLAGEVYTIKRDIFNSKKEIEVYRCEYNQLEDFFPKYYSPNYNQSSEDGFFSEFLLSSMNIPLTKLKQSPTKEDSKMVTLSFRDIFKFNYLNQDKVGSKKLLGENYAYLAKLREAFKLMYNALDTQITQLENIISELVNERNDLNKRNLSVSSFLRETEIDSLKVLEEKKQEKENELDSLNTTLEEIDKNLLSDTSELDELRKNISDLEEKITSYNEQKLINDQAIKQNFALRQEYTNDIRKIIATIEVLNKFPNIEDKNTECPVCDQNIKVSVLKEQFANTDADTIKSELNGLRRRQKELVKIHNRLRDKIEKIDFSIKKESETLNELKLQFDTQTKKMVTPYISQRDSISSKMGSLRSDLKNLQHIYKIRRQQMTIDSEILSLEARISEFREDLKAFKDSAPSLDRIFLKLGEGLQNFLEYVGMKNVNNISVSAKTFLPIIRNRDYEKITSGGVRTLSSVGFYISMLEYAMEESVNYPSFLMIDTIAKYIGKTKDLDLKETNLKEDIAEGMNDSSKYENIYNYLINLSQKSSDSFQIIVVDNDVPLNLEDKLKPYIAKHYTANPKDDRDEIGFIDDVNDLSGKQDLDDDYPYDLEIDYDEMDFELWELEAIKWISSLIDSGIVDLDNNILIFEGDFDNGVEGYTADSIESLFEYLEEQATNKAINYMPNDKDIREFAISSLDSSKLVEIVISSKEEKLSQLGWTNLEF
ncbi:AAA family ATPase [Aquimarina sp. D1M17]|uniref:AAA family ATPase n=1 Tax=Aquimarina acroporae TaxID=2937283 RepID=UPI0020BEAA73|nr:AAA family ATPase [Aquimarina acroporae]MCK8520069.1 AAA family ATPase [Aquimarina acroporae]